MDKVESPKKRKSLVWLIGMLGIAVVLAFVWWWNFRKYISTDDANVDNYRLSISSRVMAPIAAFHVSEGDTVAKGDLLVELDSTILVSRLLAAEAQLVLAKGADEYVAAKADLAALQHEMKSYRIFSPVDGQIAKQWAFTGEIVQPGQTILTLNQGYERWITAYLQETKFQFIYLNQPATFTIDAFPGLTFRGKIFYIGSNTASEFSLIPPNNASGNYTKVVQRIPLKISILSIDGDEEIKARACLVSGMSASVKLIKRE